MVVIGLSLYQIHSGWAAILLYHAVLVAALLLEGQFRLRLRKVPCGFSAGSSLILILLSAGYGYACYRAIGMLDSSGGYALKKLSQASLTPSSLWLLALYASTINPVLEELYWRGDYARKNHFFSINDPLYALIHLPIFLFILPLGQVSIPLLSLILAGMIWRYYARKHHGLATAIIGHAAGDLALSAAIIFHLPG